MSSRLLHRALRKYKETLRSMEEVWWRGAPPSTELYTIAVNVPVTRLPPWLGLDELEAIVNRAALEAIDRHRRGQVSPGQILGRKNVPPELRSQAARSMLAMRGGRATAAKMRALGFLNLVKARAAQKRKARLARGAE